ncbi:MAG: elongation factor P maturation arginine rhamnosyltransferase EarP, partial [Burkholderiales bacterium]|nr:elongation factor P maturation arginine rhamnosyltransferase EarP [Burkholderiales bacterium]
MPALRWDLYCRVVDNLGDAGVCWRLARELAARGDAVRLVIDDAAPLRLIAAQGCPGVEVLPWPGPNAPGDVVVEAFGCALPPPALDALARRDPAPVWINLEYLSAEPYVERSHGLPSPQRLAAGAWVRKWFYFPGFTARTGGLLREAGLLERRAAFDRAAWLAAQGIAWQPHEHVVVLFCYDNPAVDDLLDDLAQAPTLLLLTPGPAQRQAGGSGGRDRPGLRLHRLPWLAQPEFDHLLWSADLNFVRGEDSLVRAIWAGAPFVWQIYPQQDGAQGPKLEAMLTTLALDADAAALWRAWNGLRPGPWPGLPAPAARDA